MEGQRYHNPVQRGDYPDPSLIRVGVRDFWATTTSTEWAPQFPLFHSRDLVHWKRRGAVFNERPAWSRGSFWAPELSYYCGCYFVYYVAEHESGPLTIAVATARRPQGPYVDHGPLIGQSAGSIDPFALTGEDGKRYLIWKEDGNSIGVPTTIWVQPLRDDGLQLVGEPRVILTNDCAWEGDVVEAPCVTWRDGYLYMFYSGNACCGERCKYAVGVARSRSVLGPWEKFDGNPILDTNASWRCPGHGSIVEATDGRTFFLYHAYSRREGLYVGRQLLVDRVTWDGPGGWPQINRGSGPSVVADAPLSLERRTRRRPKNEDWQWPQGQRMEMHQLQAFGGSVTLRTSDDDDVLASVLARPTVSINYVAETQLDTSSLERGAVAGIAAYGDRENAAGIFVRDREIFTGRRYKGRLRERRIGTPAYGRIRLRLETANGYAFICSYSYDGGAHWQHAGQPMRAANLTPWDRGIRVALTLGGRAHTRATFKSFTYTDELSVAKPVRPFRFRLHGVL